MDPEISPPIPRAGRVVRLLFGAALLGAACLVLVKTLPELSSGRVEVYSKAARRTLHLQGGSAYVFAAGQLVLAIALGLFAAAQTIVYRTGSVRHPMNKLLVRAGLIDVGLACALCLAAVFSRSF